ncbi:hypothetical protein HNO88_000478 [Novosphingobium chloroacetimidivorans]|uniref:Uncharacterized protein n=1 Tax=Novosphingobium chloroacetimidivorans TaxID=1428314 RepID=A0A7W7K6N9_9SPHN|nr:hypothetical protein [Novosphingobium chloroacetimidivorans]MBB4857171.1 hypothetical protein [Novosphingobium chloroacetimidivorans]
MGEFTFGQVEAVLARQNRIADHKRVAFGGRLKFLQKNGVPHRRLKPGRGKAGAFSFSELIQLAAAVELLQVGISPQKAARIISTNLLGLEFTITQAMQFGPLKKGDKYKPYWLLMLSELGEMMEGDVPEYDQTRVLRIDTQRLTKFIADNDHWVRGQRLRMIVINGINLVGNIVALLCDDLKFSTRHLLWLSLQEEIDKESDRARGLTQLFDAEPPKWTIPAHLMTQEPLQKDHFLRANIHRFRTTDPRFGRPIPTREAVGTFAQLSIPAKQFMRYIAVSIWTKPDLTPEDLNDKSGLLTASKALRWGGEIDDLYHELIKHELLSAPSGDTPPRLTILGAIATSEIAEDVADRQLLTDEKAASSEPKGGSTDVSSEA